MGAPDEETERFLTRLAQIDPKDSSGIDLSGYTIHDCTIENAPLAHRILNGCDFRDVRFVGLDMRHSEFSEAHFKNCTFERCELDHSDLVSTTLASSTFRDCSFENGEWRSAEFVDVKFERCRFRGTTTGHCSFIRGAFDTESSQSFVDASKRFNVFVDTEFKLDPERIEFLRANFGIRSAQVLQIESPQFADPLTRLSVLYYSSRTPQHEIVDLIVAAFQGNDLKARDLARFRYAGLILRALAREHKLAPVALLDASDRILKITTRLPDHAAALELLTPVLECRREVLRTIQRAEEASQELPPGGHARLTIRMSETYSDEQARRLVGYVESFGNLPPTGQDLVAVKRGSTIMDLVVVAPIATIVWVKAVNYLLPEVRVMVARFGDVVTEAIRSGTRIRDATKFPEVANSPSTALAPSGLGHVVDGFDRNGEIDRLRRLLDSDRAGVLSFDGSCVATFSFDQRP